MRNLILIWLIWIPAGLWGQTNVVLGLLPELTVSGKLSKELKLTGQVESMQKGWEKDHPQELEADYEYIRTDFTGVLTYRWNPLWSAAGGYLIRFTDGEIVHRSIQQIATVQNLPHLRIGHRFRTDQTFVPGKAPKYRFRYRLSSELPLQGQDLNNQEWYLKGSFEGLAGLQAADWEWEQRLVSCLGHYFSRAHKVEVGLDYRLDRFISQVPRHRIWGTISYFINL